MAVRSTFGTFSLCAATIFCAKVRPGSRAAAESPVNLLMSGPAGGVAGAMYFCSRAGFDNILTFDMGGTSTDVALIQGGRARVSLVGPDKRQPGREAGRRQQ